MNASLAYRIDRRLFKRFRQGLLFSRAVLRIVGLCCLMLLLVPDAGAQSLQNINYTGYVLDADTSSLGLSNIQAQAVFNVENFTGANTIYTNVLSFRLINTNGNTVHPIYDLGNLATNTSYTYNITNIIPLAAGTNLSVTEVAYIRPAAWMSQFTQFYLECRMLTNG